MVRIKVPISLFFGAFPMAKALARARRRRRWQRLQFLVIVRSFGEIIHCGCPCASCSDRRRRCWTRMNQNSTIGSHTVVDCHQNWPPSPHCYGHRALHRRCFIDVSYFAIQSQALNPILAPNSTTKTKQKKSKSKLQHLKGIKNISESDSRRSNEDMDIKEMRNLVLLSAKSYGFFLFYLFFLIFCSSTTVIPYAQS